MLWMIADNTPEGIAEAVQSLTTPSEDELLRARVEVLEAQVLGLMARLDKAAELLVAQASRGGAGNDGK